MEIGFPTAPHKAQSHETAQNDLNNAVRKRSSGCWASTGYCWWPGGGSSSRGARRRGVGVLLGGQRGVPGRAGLSPGWWHLAGSLGSKEHAEPFVPLVQDLNCVRFPPLVRPEGEEGGSAPRAKVGGGSGSARDRGCD